MRLMTSTLATLAAVLALVDGPALKINTTDSLPRGLYRVTQEPLSRGVLVEECLPLELAKLARERDYLPKGSCPGEVGTILKQVVGLPGDRIEIGHSYVAVNGRLILNTETREKDAKGRAIPARDRGTFTLQEGEIFLLATNSERSWDGRYMGATKVADVIATLMPVWTEAANGL